MAHFARLDKDNTVVDILKVDNELILDDNGVEQESIGIQKLQVGNPGGTFVKTSYNTEANEHRAGGTPFRKNYPAVGYTYDPVRDAFYAPQPFESWTLNEDKCIWECPLPHPEQDEENPIPYYWKDDTQEWVDYEYYSEPYSYEHIYPSWIWNTSTGEYEPPIAEPDIEDKNSYIWSEENEAWMLWNDETEKWEII